MKEYKITINRTFTGIVQDTYKICAESKEEAIERFKELAESPAEMAILPHDTKINQDLFEYNDDAICTIGLDNIALDVFQLN